MPKTQRWTTRETVRVRSPRPKTTERWQACQPTAMAPILCPRAGRAPMPKVTPRVEKGVAPLSLSLRASARRGPKPRPFTSGSRGFNRWTSVSRGSARAWTSSRSRSSRLSSSGGSSRCTEIGRVRLPSTQGLFLFLCQASAHVPLTCFILVLAELVDRLRQYERAQEIAHFKTALDADESAATLRREQKAEVDRRAKLLSSFKESAASRGDGSQPSDEACPDSESMTTMDDAASSLAAIAPRQRKSSRPAAKSDRVKSSTEVAPREAPPASTEEARFAKADSSSQRAVASAKRTVGRGRDDESSLIHSGPRDPNGLPEDDDKPCALCGSTEDGETCMLCDSCDVAAHTGCLGLKSVPDGDWACPWCENHVTFQSVKVCSALVSFRPAPSDASCFGIGNCSDASMACCEQGKKLLAELKGVLSAMQENPQGSCEAASEGPSSRAAPAAQEQDQVPYQEVRQCSWNMC